LWKNFNVTRQENFMKFTITTCQFALPWPQQSAVMSWRLKCGWSLIWLSIIQYSLVSFVIVWYALCRVCRLRSQYSVIWLLYMYLHQRLFVEWMWCDCMVMCGKVIAGLSEGNGSIMTGTWRLISRHGRANVDGGPTFTFLPIVLLMQYYWLLSVMKCTVAKWSILQKKCLNKCHLVNKFKSYCKHSRTI